MDATESTIADRVEVSPGPPLFAQTVRELIASTDAPHKRIEAIAGPLAEAAQLAALFRFTDAGGRRTTDKFQRLDEGRSVNLDQQAHVWAEIVQQACSSGVTQFRDTNDGVAWPVVAVPLSEGRPSEALVAVLGPDTTLTTPRVVELVNVVAAELRASHWRFAAQQAEQDAQASAAVLELVDRLDHSESLKGGCRALAHGLEALLPSQRIAIGVCRRPTSHCQIQAISGFDHFDRHGEIATALAAALDESVLLGKVVRWPIPEGRERVAARTHEQLLGNLGAREIISAPFHDADGKVVAACLLVNPETAESAHRAERFLAASAVQIGSTLRRLQQRRREPVGRLRRWATRSLTRHKMAAITAAVVLLAVLLAWPRPHKVRCDCQLQPLVRRFVAAPYDGTLLKSLVQPGDIVAEGDVLAEMDGRETRIELAARQAEYGRARKAWKVSLSLDDIHEAQQAKLEMRRLQMRIKLLEQQQNNLQIRSPIDGIVVSGDLENRIGAPLKIGQSLFEVAPLDNMYVELVIPEADIAYVSKGLPVEIRLEAYPRRPLTARVTQIIPRAEAREDAFVFVAQAEIANADQTLRPGMNGKAKVAGARRPLAWLLFHKPYESLLLLLGW